MKFTKKNVTELQENFINAIGNEWMLITAGTADGFNTMTASWGFVGEMWGKHCAIAAIRPQRYTKQFVDQNEYFTLSFYGENKKIHAVCGKQSGRQVNKPQAAGLTPVFDAETGAPYFAEARLVLICKKLYTQPLKPSSFTPAGKEIPATVYPQDDYHEMYYGEIVTALLKEQE